MEGTDLECGQKHSKALCLFPGNHAGLMEMRQRQQTRLHRVQRTSGEPVWLAPGNGARRGKAKGEQSTGTVAVELSTGAPTHNRMRYRQVPEEHVLAYFLPQRRSHTVQ